MYEGQPLVGGVCISVVSCLVVLAEDDGVDLLDLIDGLDIPTPVVVHDVAAFADLRSVSLLILPPSIPNGELSS